MRLLLPYCSLLPVVLAATATSNCTGPAWRCMPPHVYEAQSALLHEIDRENAGSVVKCSDGRKSKCCGDGVCDGPESIASCLEDCPGVTTDATCGEEPHSDRGGRTLTFGVGHRATSAQDCCVRPLGSIPRPLGHTALSLPYCVCADPAVDGSRRASAG